LTQILQAASALVSFEIKTDNGSQAPASRSRRSYIERSVRLADIQRVPRVDIAPMIAPILGDSLYSHTQPVQEIQDAFDFPNDRIFLHASQISFYVGLEFLTFPYSLIALLQRYRRSGGKKRFRIRLIAPLPYDFVRICSEARILVNDYEQGGGLFVSESGNENDYQHVVNGEIPDVNGYWIPLQ
jgi:hypothetical protein